MNRRIIALLGTVYGTAGLFAGAPTAAFAQSAQSAAPNNVEEIVVTAQRREEKMVDVPISITALGQQQLTTSNVQNLADIAKVTTGVRFDNQAGFFQPTIRGISAGITTSGGGSNVGVYIDGFYSPNPLAADFQLTNVESVQVLKGPQGTLFGHNTTGGAILITTAEPSTDPHAQAKIDYGRFNAQRYQGYATAGLGGNVALDVEGLYSKGNGFLTNIIDGNHHVGAYENWTVRTGLKVELGDNVSVLARYNTHSRENDPTATHTNTNTDTSINPTTGAPFGFTTVTIPGFFTTNPDQVAETNVNFLRSDTDIAQLTVKADLGFGNLTSYSQWREEDVDQSLNESGQGFPIFQLGLPIFDKTYSQEFLLASKPGPRLQWTGGFFFFSNRDEYVTWIDNAVKAGGPRIRIGGSDTVTQSYAGYVDGTYELMPKLYLTAGARYAHDVVKDAYYYIPFGVAAGKQFVPSIGSNKVTPRAVIRYKPTDESSIYASYSMGYKAAIIDVGGSCQDGPAFKCNPVKPENVNAFEVGYKYDDQRFSMQAAAFYYDYKNLQVSEFLGSAQAFIVNAASSEIYGLEDQIHYAVNDHIQVDAGASWTHARYKTFGTTVNGVLFGAPIYATCSPTVPPKYAASCGPGSFLYLNQDSVLHGTHMEHSPDFTATLGARYTTGMLDTGEYSLAGNLYYTSSFFFSPSGTQFRQPGYATLDLRAEWKHPSEHYTVAVYATNVTDERYRTQVQFNGFGAGATWNAPVAWGVEVGAKF